MHDFTTLQGLLNTHHALLCKKFMYGKAKIVPSENLLTQKLVMCQCFLVAHLAL